MTRRQHRKRARRCPAVREAAARVGHLAVCLVLGPPFLAVLALMQELRLSLADRREALTLLGLPADAYMGGVE